MRILIAPDSFKESLPAPQVCAAIARGLRRVLPDAELDLVPMADGGEGTVEALLAATGGRWCETTVRGPLGEPAVARWGVLGEGRTAVLEMAAASGLALVPQGRRDPTQTTTYGTGQLIAAALHAGVSEILIGIGGSATNDGGAGAAQALGVRFLDSKGNPLPDGLSGERLPEVVTIDLRTRDPRIGVSGGRASSPPREAASPSNDQNSAREVVSGSVPIRAACDVDNPLCGPRGAAAVYAPQKGATPSQVQTLDAGLAHLAALIARDCGVEVRDLPGAGAAGGLGAGLLAFAGATLEPGVQIVMDASHLAERIARADLVITGEGRLDGQSMMGKVIAGVGRAAKAANVPVVALAGCLGPGVEACRELLAGWWQISPPGLPLTEALPRTAEFLELTAARELPRFLR